MLSQKQGCLWRTGCATRHCGERSEQKRSDAEQAPLATRNFIFKNQWVLKR